MFTRLHENRHEVRVAALLSAIGFAFFVVLVPIFHRHAGEWGSGLAVPSASALVSRDGPSSHSVRVSAVSALSRASAIGESHGLTPPIDDCPLCQWFGVGFTPPCVVALLAFAAVLAALLFIVCLTELCRRPLPRRGLRAPPTVCA